MGPDTAESWIWKAVSSKKLNICSLHNLETMFLETDANELKVMVTQKSVCKCLYQLYS